MWPGTCGRVAFDHELWGRVGTLEHRNNVTWVNTSVAGSEPIQTDLDASVQGL